MVVVKELLDNALDAIEEAVAPAKGAPPPPKIEIRVDAGGITVSDNGPGIPPETVAGVKDFSIRVSSREAYVAPDRGKQGNALKTILAMPFVLSDCKQGKVKVTAAGVRHRIEFTVNHISGEPKVRHDRDDVNPANRKNGTEIWMEWPDSARSILVGAKDRFLLIADDFTWLNPHLSITTNWFGDSHTIEATDPTWEKWRPSHPTCAHWYTPQRFVHLITRKIADDKNNGRGGTVRDLVSEFRGLRGSAALKKVLDATELHRAQLSRLVTEHGVNDDIVIELLTAMQAHSKPVKPSALGKIGKDHLRQRFEAAGCEMATFDYRKGTDITNGVPEMVEVAFGWCPDVNSRRLVTGVNWSPGIINPFRELGVGESLDTVLTEQRARRDEPVIFVMHMASPRVDYTDQGKSAVVIQS